MPLEFAVTKKWSEKWVRVYRTMNPEDIQVLNEYREIFVSEAEILAQGFSSGKRKKYVNIVIVYISLSKAVKYRKN